MSKLYGKHKNCRGFTLIELLVVVLILSILAMRSGAAALPERRSLIPEEETLPRANMQTIANAAVAARVKSGELDFSTIVAANSSGIIITGTDSLLDLNAVPVCPSQGSYTPAGNSRLWWRRYDLRLYLQCKYARHFPTRTRQ